MIIQSLPFRNIAFSLLRPGKSRPTTIPHHPAFHTTAAHSNYIKHLQDEKIPHPIVQLVDPESGRLTAPTTLQHLLASIDRKLSYLELVSAEPAPIVKLINRQEAFQKRKEAKARAKAVARRNAHKEVQLTWGAARADLAHKLGRARAELERGGRVDVVFAPKRGQAMPGAAEMRARAQETVDGMKDVAKEYKPREFQRTMVAIFLQGFNHPEQEALPERTEPKLVKKKAPPPVAEVQDLFQD